MYEAENPGKRVCVIDSLSAGPELVLLLEKLEQLAEEGLPFEEICSRIEAYKQHTGLAFMLASLKNFAATTQKRADCLWDLKSCNQYLKQKDKVFFL